MNKKIKELILIISKEIDLNKSKKEICENVINKFQESDFVVDVFKKNENVQSQIIREAIIKELNLYLGDLNREFNPKSKAAELVYVLMTSRIAKESTKLKWLE